MAEIDDGDIILELRYITKAYVGDLTTSPPSANGKYAMGSNLSRSSTVRTEFCPHTRKARRCSASRAIP